MSQVGFFLYTGDWLKDTRCLKPSVKGHWIDLLCVMRESPVRGELTWPLHAYCSQLGVSASKAVEIINELLETGVAEGEFLNDVEGECGKDCETNHVDLSSGFDVVRNCNENVRLRNRRMYREGKAAEKNKGYVKKHREKNSGKFTVRENLDNVHPSLPSPSLNLFISKEDKSAKNVRRVKIPQNPIFPPEWNWLELWVKRQNAGFPIDRFLDWSWWDAVSETCGGLSEPWLEIQAASWKRWIMDNPARAPTPKGYRTFVAGWLQRNYERERRSPSGQTKR